MVALIAVVIIVAVSTLGGTLNDMFTNVETKIPAPTTAATTTP
ncbi:Flp family type IVb pilin [Arthrobacter nitrophenolicus]|nr:Flp family type IVb pilin [Arthrobacter nitrophenolicus]